MKTPMIVQSGITEAISSFDELERRQRRRIKKLLKAGKRRTAEILKGCGEGHRCGHPKCVICAHEAKTKNVDESFLVRDIRLDAIEVPNDHRHLDADKVEALNESVELLGGFRIPITVRKKVDKETGTEKYILVTGAYRWR